MVLKKSYVLFIAVLLILVSGAATWKYVYQKNRVNGGSSFMEITVNGDLFARERLLIQEERKEILVPVRSGYHAVVVIDHGSISVLPMPKEICPLGICSKMGPISKPGESIICMPNKMIIKVLSNEEIL